MPVVFCHEDGFGTQGFEVSVVHVVQYGQQATSVKNTRKSLHTAALLTVAWWDVVGGREHVVQHRRTSAMPCARTA